MAAISPVAIRIIPMAGIFGYREPVCPVNSFMCRMVPMPVSSTGGNLTLQVRDYHPPSGRLKNSGIGAVPGVVMLAVTDTGGWRNGKTADAWCGTQTHDFLVCSQLHMVVRL